MNILNNIVSGAARQFGREFGRAGANSLLKGANSYTVKGSSDYSGRLKPSDSEVVKGIKGISKIKFVSTNKANVSRLIEITDIAISNLKFKGRESLNELNDVMELISQYDEKFNHGSSLIDDDFKDKSLDYLKERRNKLVNITDEFDKEFKDYITENLEIEKSKRKSKRTASLLAIPLLGLQWAYLKSPVYTILSIVFFVTIIMPIINLIVLIRFLFMSQEKFDLEFNPEYVYFKQFDIKNES